MTKTANRAGAEGFSTALVAVATVRETIQTLRQRQALLNEEHTALDQQNRLMYRLPLTPLEVRAVIHRAIDQWGESFLPHWIPALQDFVYPKGKRPASEGGVSIRAALPSTEPVSLQDLELMERDAPTRIFSDPDTGLMFDMYSNLVTGLLDRAYAWDNPMNRERQLAGMFFFFGDLIKAKVDAHIDAIAAKTLNVAGSEVVEIDADAVQATATRIVELQGEISRLKVQNKKIDEMHRLHTLALNFRNALPPEEKWGRRETLSWNESADHAVAELRKAEQGMEALDPQKVLRDSFARRGETIRNEGRIQELRKELAAFTATGSFTLDQRRASIAKNDKRIAEIMSELATIEQQLKEMKV